MKPCFGIFDSGVGGFTVLKRIADRHGDLPCLYLADTARVPYGDKSPEQIRLIATEVVKWFRNKNLSVVVVACNTTNSLAFDVVKNLADVPVLGLIQAGVEMITKKRVGVLATSATISSSAYSDFIKVRRPNSLIYEQSCPAFVPLIEQGQISSKEMRMTAIKYLRPMIENHVEEVVLGCSHYPLLEPLLRDLLPDDVRLIDPAIGLAIKLDKILSNSKFIQKSPFSHSNTRFCVTSDPVDFAKKTNIWLGSYKDVDLVSLC